MKKGKRYRNFVIIVVVVVTALAIANLFISGTILSNLGPLQETVYTDPAFFAPSDRGGTGTEGGKGGGTGDTPGVDEMSGFSEIEQIDTGNDPENAGCVALYESSAICMGEYRNIGDSCATWMDGEFIIEQLVLPEPCSQTITLSSDPIDCNMFCPGSEGRCVPKPDFCDDGAASAQCECFPSSPDT
jgi:hypothetical protein